MKRSEKLGTASTGVHHVAKIASQNNSIFETVDQQNDVGIDAWMDLVAEGEATGCWIALQIKSGRSYCSSSGWQIPADAAHLKYWRSHSLPVCGIVYDPDSDAARWVDISAFLAARPDLDRGCDIVVPHDNRFDLESFPKFRQHFLDYRTQFANDAFFGRCLRQFSRLEEVETCDSAMRALFSFHRDRPGTWYFLIMSLPSFRNHPLIRRLAAMLCHIPGHGDIFWHRKNMIDEATRFQAMEMLRHYLVRDSVVSLLGAVDENGIGRGSIGQCVCAIILQAYNRKQIMESIILDPGLDEDLRFWAVLVLIFGAQGGDVDGLVEMLNDVKKHFTEDNRDRVVALSKDLKKWGYIDFS